jgi:predicted metal-dependent phosphoesterase TrpH
VGQRRVDLQTHSTCSDGTCPPAKIVERADQRDLAAVALTDHDTVEGLPAFEAAGEGREVETVPGVELSARLGRQDLDLLGYLVEPGDDTLQATLERARSYRRERIPRLLERLEEVDAPVERATVREAAGDAPVGRPHVARAMVEAGHVDDVDAAFEGYLGEGQPAYVPKERLDPPEATEAIHAAGGVAVLAHPCFVHPGAFPRVLEALVDAGLDGIEVWHSDHDPTHVQFFGQQADRHGLVKTGGSDFHGDNKPGIELGEGRGGLEVPFAAVEALRERRRELHG